MTLFERIFGQKKTSAQTAKDRLKFMLAHERVDCNLPYLDDLKNDLIEVIRKYTKVEDLKIKSETNQSLEMLEVEIILGK